MGLTTAKTAIDLLITARKAVENLSQRAQASNDLAIKKSIGEIFDTFNALRVAVERLMDENAELRRAQIDKPPQPEIRQLGETSYYFVGEKGPYCPKCYHNKGGQLVPLAPRDDNYAGGTGRKCLGCDAVFFEKSSSALLSSSRPPGPDGWMA